MTTIGICYLILINLIAFALFGIDKRRAKIGAYRISERTLFLSAILGGSMGALAAMYLFRHKTRHLSFTAGIPAILVIQVIAAASLLAVSSGLPH